MHPQPRAEPLREVDETLRADVEAARDEERPGTQHAPHIEQERHGNRRVDLGRRERQHGSILTGQRPCDERQRRLRRRRRERAIEGTQPGAAAGGAAAEEDDDAGVVQEEITRDFAEQAQALGRGVVVHRERERPAAELVEVELLLTERGLATPSRHLSGRTTARCRLHRRALCARRVWGRRRPLHPTCARG